MKNKTQRDKELRVLADFIVIYCRELHRDFEKPVLTYPKLATLLKPGDILCPECVRLLAYGMGKLMQCPHDPKPMCKKCQTQCFTDEYRAAVRRVMRFSGSWLIKHGRVDLILHYYL